VGVPVYLLEVSYLDPATMQAGMLRCATGGYCTRPDDDPANTFYAPRIKVPNNWQAAVFKDGLTGGGADGGNGVAQLIALESEGEAGDYLDQYMRMAFDGQPLRLLYGDNEAPYSDFAVILTGTQSQPEFTWGYMSVKVRDYSKFFDKALSQYTFLGNNVAGVGIEGTPDDLMGKTKPLCFGRCPNISPPCVSAYYMLFMVHAGVDGRGGQIKAVDAVHVDAVAWALDTSHGGDGAGGAGDFATPATLAASTITDGAYFQTCLAYGLVKIAGAVSSGITCDVRGCALGGIYVDTVPGIIRRIVEHYIRRKRVNLIQWSEDFSQAVWTASGLTKGAVIASGQFAGMTPLVEDASTGTHTLSQSLTLGTGMYCFSIPVTPAGRTLARLKLVNPSNTANNCLADFDLTTGEVLLLQANGAAVGPQYEATGFITDGGTVVDSSGALRIWVAGQPDESFSQIQATLSLLSGTAGSYTDSYAGSGAIGAYVGAPSLGAQIEAYSSPAIYTGPTTASPAAGYDPPVGPEVHADSFTALASLGTANGEVGYAVAAGDTTTASDVLSAIASSLGCWWAFDRNGLMRIGQLSRPSAAADPVAQFTLDVDGAVSTIIEGSFDRSAPFDSNDGTMAYRIIMQCVHNWTTQQKSACATVLWENDPTRVAWVGKEWREIRAENLSTLAAHPLACELSFTSYLTKFSDALAECKRLLAFYGQYLDRFTFRTTIDSIKKVNIGDIVSIRMPRFQLDDGKNFVVTSITEVHEMAEATVEVIG